MDLTGTDPQTTGLQAPSVGSRSSTLRLGYPIVLTPENTFLSIQLGLQHIQFDYDAWTSDLPTADQAYLADVSVAVHTQLSARWTLLVQASPSMATGGDGTLAREDFTVHGAALATRKVGQQSSVGLGAAYSTAFGAPIPLPVVQLERRGLLWKGGPDWQGKALLPASLELWTTATPRLTIGAQARALGSRHHLGRRAAALSAPFAESVNLVVGPSVLVQVAPRMVIGVESGVSLYRQMRVTDGRDEVLRFEPGQTAFVRTYLTFGS